MRLKINLDFTLLAMACFSIKIKFFLAILLGSILFLPFSVKAESPIVITEILPAPKDRDWNNDGQVNTKEEWIELYNGSDLGVNLSSWKLYEKPVDNYFNLTGLLIKPKEYLVIYKNQLNFALNNDTDEIWLIDDSGKEAFKMSYGSTGKAVEYNYSYNFDGATWQWSNQPTPGVANVISTPVEETVKSEETTQSSGSTQTSKSTPKTTTSSATPSSSTPKTENKPTVKTEEANPQEVATSEVAGVQNSNAQDIYIGQPKNTNKVYGWVLIALGGAFIILFGAFQWKKEQALEFIQKIQNRPKN